MLENLDLLNKSYTENYRVLKQNLGIDGDFDFIIYNESQQVWFSANNPMVVKPSNVLSRNIPLTIINKDAKQIKIVFNLRVWK